MPVNRGPYRKFTWVSVFHPNATILAPDAQITRVGASATPPPVGFPTVNVPLPLTKPMASSVPPPRTNMARHGGGGAAPGRHMDGNVNATQFG
jgi:hypothetical protein